MHGLVIVAKTGGGHILSAVWGLSDIVGMGAPFSQRCHTTCRIGAPQTSHITARGPHLTNNRGTVGSNLGHPQKFIPDQNELAMGHSLKTTWDHVTIAWKECGLHDLLYTHLLSHLQDLSAPDWTNRTEHKTKVSGKGIHQLFLLGTKPSASARDHVQCTKLISLIPRPSSAPFSWPIRDLKKPVGQRSHMGPENRVGDGLGSRLINVVHWTWSHALANSFVPRRNGWWMAYSTHFSFVFCPVCPIRGTQIL